MGGWGSGWCRREKSVEVWGGHSTVGDGCLSAKDPVSPGKDSRTRRPREETSTGHGMVLGPVEWARSRVDKAHGELECEAGKLRQNPVGNTEATWQASGWGCAFGATQAHRARLWP